MKLLFCVLVENPAARSPWPVCYTNKRDAGAAFSEQVGCHTEPLTSILTNLEQIHTQRAIYELMRNTIPLLGRASLCFHNSLNSLWQGFPEESFKILFYVDIDLHRTICADLSAAHSYWK